MWKRRSQVSRSDPAGDGKIAWDEQFQRHGRWLRTVVISRLGEPQAVDDVMQEVALAAVRSASPPTDQTKIAPWLYRIAVRQVLLYRRKMGRQRKLAGAVAANTRPHDIDTATEPSAWLMAQERRGELRRAISRLAPQDAEILMLKYTEDWSYQQIVQYLGISQSAVEARLHRARKRLREQLETPQPPSSDQQSPGD